MTITTRTKLIIGLVLVVVVLGLLIRTAVTRAATYYVTVQELLVKGHAAVGEETTVSGNIVGASVQWDPAKSLLQFQMDDNPQGRRLPVVFHGDKPDDFANDWPVIVTGTLNADGTFEASKLLIKCPSKYQAANQSQTQTFTAKPSP